MTEIVAVDGCGVLEGGVADVDVTFFDKTGKEGADDVGGKLYTENNVAALKGYCGVLDPRGIPTIWGLVPANARDRVSPPQPEAHSWCGRF